MSLSLESIFGGDEGLNKGLNQFTINVIDRKVKEIGWDFDDGDNYLIGILRNTLISAAVACGHPEYVFL